MFKVVMGVDMVSAISTPSARRHRAGGWSEGFYDDSNIANTRRDLADLCAKRAALLPVGFAINKTKIIAVDPVGPTEVGLVNYPGIAGNPGDVPQMALQFSLKSSSSANSRTIKLAGLPDGRAVEGEYNHEPAYDAALMAYLTFVAGYRFRGRVISATTYPIISITPVTGSLLGEADILLEGPADLGSGVMVQVLRTMNAAGQLKGARVKSSTAGGSGTIRVLGWKLGATQGGKIRASDFGYFVIAGFGGRLPEPLVTQRRIGRPSSGYRGRRSKRR